MSAVSSVGSPTRNGTLPVTTKWPFIEPIDFSIRRLAKTLSSWPSITNAVINGTVYNTMANPNNSSITVNTLPAGLPDMSMISPNPAVVSVITVV